ncbi:MAG: 3-methyladenine DNA glycosylase [Micropruina sp.]|nr:MAG: 3-methyladenine DNA glycosylase [Micropruina sp.]
MAALAAAHQRRVDALVADHLRRRSRGERHPIEDFLFEYYSYRPGALRRWHPGWGVRLAGDVTAFGSIRGFAVAETHAHVDPRLAESRSDEVAWIRDLLVATQNRPAALGCFGLHEWAMVYRLPADELRHRQLPLRLGSAGTDEVVERHRIACTHYDAYRFFTPEAVGLNTRRPTLTTRIDNEQPGCLHAAMDTYKWAYKLAPFTPAALVVDCFVLAREIRVIDMRASPYDVTALGHSPIAIETPAGKSEYLHAQRHFADAAAVLRRRLIEVCDAVLA